MRRISLALCALAVLLPLPAAAQESGSERLRLFLDCSGFSCDPDFYRTEIGFVNHVRDARDADVHLLITRQTTGGGGGEYTLTLLGQRRFAGMTDTLRYASPQTESEDDRRRGIARTAKLGLARYAARTPAGSRLQISFAAPQAGDAAEAPVADPWNFWTFRTSVRGFFNGESRVRSRNLSGSLTANRVTDDWKVQLSANGNDSRSLYEISDTQTVQSEQHSYGVNGLVVRSLGPNLSAGLRSSATASTFLNQDMRLRFAPAIEYSVFPYAESTRRQFTLLYSAGVNYFDYDVETIFGYQQQTLPDHSLLGSLDFKQPWGSVNLSVEGTQYLHDASRFRADMFTDLDLRLVRGLALNLFGNLSWVRDQLHLPAGDASPEEVLLRLRQLDTNYRYFASIGLSYTFGSIYNNVVNPRFAAGRGGM